MDKKKIAVFIDWFLPGYKAGGPITSVANLVENLKDFFEFYIITSDRDYLEKQPYKGVEFDKWIDFDKNVKIIYISPKNLTISKVRKLLKSLDVDYFYVNGIYSFYFSILPVYFSKKLNKNIVVASRGMLSEHALARRTLKKQFFLLFVDFFKFYKNVVFHATNNNEAEHIKNVIKRLKDVKIAPNLPQKVDIKDFKHKNKETGKLRLVSIARISTEKNTKFAIEKLLDIKEGEVILDLYGSIYDKNYWNECLQIIELLPENVKVNYKGTVNRVKVKEVLQNYHFAFLPSKGENFGHSIFEALSTGTPVIISDKTPWQNLEKIRVGWDIELTDSQKFKHILEYCIDMSQNEYDDLSKNAFNFAKDFIENSNLIEKTRKLFL